jgi:hypothetical protein
LYYSCQRYVRIYRYVWELHSHNKLQLRRSMSSTERVYRLVQPNYLPFHWKTTRRHSHGCLFVTYADAYAVIYTTCLLFLLVAAIIPHYRLYTSSDSRNQWHYLAHPPPAGAWVAPCRFFIPRMLLPPVARPPPPPPAALERYERP